MKKNVLTIVLLPVLIIFTGCANKNVVTAPVPGSLNTYDAYAFRVLADTQAALNAFKADVASGKVAETPAIKSTLNQTIADYNIAEAVYQAWHTAGGTGSTTSLASSIATVQSDVSSLASPGGAQ